MKRDTAYPVDASAEHLDALLINPPWISKDRNIWHGIKGAMPPLGLLSIAACVEQEGLRVRVFDAHVLRWSIEQLKAELRTVKPAVVGISMMTTTSLTANRIARIVKEIHPSCTVVVGGVHADALPEECLRNSSIDIVARGDGERTFLKILAGEPLDTIPGISYRHGEHAVHNPPTNLIENLDELPMPAYHLVPMRKYYPAIGAYRQLPAINMLMTRGCPGRCTFCNSAQTPLRARSAALVVDEIAMLRKKYGIREIQFYDDTFTVMRKNCLEFCRLMKERNLGVSWTAFVRSDCLDREMAIALKEGGCHQIMIGVESSDEEILRSIRKPIDRKRTREAILLGQEVGLEVRATFMLGNPGETVGSMKRTIDYALQLDPDLAIFNITTPYPGTEMFNWAKANGYLATEDWSDYELSHPVMILPTVTPSEIKDAYALAHKSFYNRSAMFLRRLWKIRGLHHLLDNIRAFVYIIIRKNIWVRESSKIEWIEGSKDDFWDIPLHRKSVNRTLSTATDFRQRDEENELKLLKRA